MTLENIIARMRSHQLTSWKLEEFNGQQFVPAGSYMVPKKDVEGNLQDAVEIGIAKLQEAVQLAGNPSTQFRVELRGSQGSNGAGIQGPFQFSAAPMGASGTPTAGAGLAGLFPLGTPYGDQQIQQLQGLFQDRIRANESSFKEFAALNEQKMELKFQQWILEYERKKMREERDEMDRELREHRKAMQSAAEPYAEGGKMILDYALGELGLKKKQDQVPLGTVEPVEEEEENELSADDQLRVDMINQLGAKIFEVYKTPQELQQFLRELSVKLEPAAQP